MKQDIDYKQRYERSLDAAERFWSELSDNGSMSNDEIREHLESMFSEFEEGREERIKQALINHVQCQLGNSEFAFYGWTKKQIVDWLNRHSEAKQDEQRVQELLITEYEKGKADALAELIEPKFSVGEYVKNLETNDKMKIEQVSYKRQCYTCQYWDGAATVHVDFKFSDQDKWIHIKQEITDTLINTERFEYEAATSKFEWTTEDAKMIDSIINDIEIASEQAHIEQLKDVYSNEIQLLKRIRERHYWEPSEEQMATLYDAMVRASNRADKSALLDYKILRSLYYNLRNVFRS